MELLDYLEENDIDYKEEDGKIVVSGDLDLSYSQITKLPNTLSVGGDLDLSNSQITELPNKLSVGGGLNLWSTPITKLPDGLSVGGWLDLKNTKITELPNELSVGGWLDLSNTKITKLPEKLSVGGFLNLWNTPITKLPDNLSVGGNLDLSFTQITKLPEGLTVKGRLTLDAEKITNIAYRENCGEFKRTIFATYVNGEIQISAGCFLGILKKFESAVDDKYSGTKAEKYKQAARECVKELEEMRKDKTKLKKIHELKISSQHFKDVVSGAKTAEIRYRDRDY